MIFSLPLGPIPACAGQPIRFGNRCIFCGAYPRVCGATAYGKLVNTLRGGLSPRVRGNRPRKSVDPLRMRPIPACAGQPIDVSNVVATITAYPRVCGATPDELLRCGLLLGLSPRVRGNLSALHAAQLAAGPIPACAGQPIDVSNVVATITAYPRVCGATPDELLRCGLLLGLSPRVRGNLSALHAAQLAAGPIPACAGQPSLVATFLGRVGAYPRVCGATGK